MKRSIGFFIIVFALSLVACGPSPQEIATMTAEAWTPTLAPTNTPVPTSTSTSTPTPIPYDLTLSIQDEEGNAIGGAAIQIAGDEQFQTADGAGVAKWNNLPGETVALLVDAQGYEPTETTLTLERGSNEATVTLALDPTELHPAQACLPSETLVALEDFEDGRGQDWGAIAEQVKPDGWSVVANPEDAEDMVLQITGDAIFADVNHVTPGAFVFRLRARIDGPGRMAISIFERRTTDVPKTQYNVFLGTTESSIIRWNADEGSMIPVSQGPIMVSGNWYLFEISFFEGTIQVWANGDLWMSVTDPDPFPGEGRGSNYVVFPESDDTLFYSDDYSICELSSPFMPMQTPAPEE